MNAFNNEMNSMSTATNSADTTRDADTIRIADAFSHGPAFIPFVTAGDPTVDTTRLFVQQMVAAGADLIEIGIPFSDPTAEGPVIQGANIRALNASMTTDKAFELVHTLRDQDGVRAPLVFMTYANVVFSYPGASVHFASARPKPWSGASSCPMFLSRNGRSLPSQLIVTVWHLLG